jgi:hypothetical protein
MSTSSGLTTFTLKHDPLTPIEGRPTPEGVRKLRQELYANVRGITTDLGGGQHGHLGLLMPDADYLALPGAAAYILPPTRADIPSYEKQEPTKPRQESVKNGQPSTNSSKLSTTMPMASRNSS